MTHDEQARELVEQYLAHPAGRPALSLGEKMDLRVRISTALAASHLAGWRAAREAAADEAEAACHCNGNIGDDIRALPAPVPAPTDPERAARLAEIAERLHNASAWPWRVAEDSPVTVMTCGIIHVATAFGMDGIDAANAAFIAAAPDDIAYLLSLIPEATR